MATRTSHPVPDRVVATFFEKVDVRGNDECWPWRLSRHGQGYGQLGWRANGRTVVTTAHRVAWTAAFGAIAEGYEIRQVCLNRLCQNPGHLELVSTSQANWERAANNRDKTHCPKGHPYAGENLLHHAGERRCRICALDSRHERVRRTRALDFFCRRLERDMEVDSVTARLESPVELQREGEAWAS